MSNHCYIIYEREFVNSKKDVYKIGKTTKGIKRIAQYPKGSEPILFMQVKNCHEFEKKIKIKFNKKYKQRSDIGTEYFEGDKIQMINDFMLENYNDETDVKSINTNESIYNKYESESNKNILDQEQTYYYPVNELNEFYKILKMSIKNFNENNKTEIKYDHDSSHLFMNTYINILNLYISKNEEIKTKLLEIKTKIEHDGMEFEILRIIIEKIIISDINLTNIQDNEKNNIILNTIIIWFETNFEFETEKYDEMTLLYNTNKIKQHNNKKIQNKMLANIYKIIADSKIMNEIIEIKLNVNKSLLKNAKTYFVKELSEYTGSYNYVNEKKRILFSKYYKNNASYCNFTLNMMTNIKNCIQNVVDYDIICDNDNNYVGIKYGRVINGGSLITNIPELYCEIEENLEGWITNNMHKMCEDETIYMTGLKLKFLPISLIKIIKKITNITSSVNKINESYEFEKEISYKKRNCHCEYFDIDYDTDDESDYDDDKLETNENPYEKCSKYHTKMKTINKIGTKICELLLKNNNKITKKITKKITIDEKYYNKLLKIKNKVLKKFLKTVKITKYYEHIICKSNGIGKVQTFMMYDMFEKKIINNNFYSLFSSAVPYINNNKNKIKNTIEYEILLNSLMSVSDLIQFKKMCKSVLIKNENIKCQILNPNECNLLNIFLWLLYKLNYTKIDINLKNDNVNNYKQTLSMKKKIIIIHAHNEIDISNAIKIMNKYPNNNYIINNHTATKIEYIYVVCNFNISKHNINIITQYTKNKDNIENIKYEIYDLLDTELILMVDWICECDILKNTLANT